MFTWTNQHETMNRISELVLQGFSKSQFHPDNASNVPGRALKNLPYQDFTGVRDTFRFLRLQYIPSYFRLMWKKILPQANLLALSDQYFSS